MQPKLTRSDDGTYNLPLTETELLVINRLLVQCNLGDDNKFTQAALNIILKIEADYNETLDGVCDMVGFDAVLEVNDSVAATMCGDELTFYLKDLEV